MTTIDTLICFKVLHQSLPPKASARILAPGHPPAQQEGGCREWEYINVFCNDGNGAYYCGIRNSAAAAAAAATTTGCHISWDL